MKVILKVVKVDNKFNKPTAHIQATMENGILRKSIYLYSESGAKEGDTMEMTMDEFNQLKITQKESKTNPGRFYNVLAL